MSLDGPSHVRKPMSETRSKYGYVKHPPNRWTPELEAQLITKAEAGESNSAIAREWGMTRDAVCNKRAKMASQGLIDHTAPRWTAEEESKLIELKVDGHNTRAIAKLMGKTMQSIKSKAAMIITTVDSTEPGDFGKYCKEATTKLVALLCEHHPEHETRL